MNLPSIKTRAKTSSRHLLFLGANDAPLPPALPKRALWQALIKRRRIKPDELSKTPLALDFPDGRRGVYAAVDAALPRFERLTQLRKAAMLLLDETPERIALVDLGAGENALRDAVYVLCVNGAPLPAQKKHPARPLREITLIGADEKKRPQPELSTSTALARANLLARELTVLPPNALTPASYRQRIRALAKQQRWQIEEFDFKRLKKMGAGAFCAVAQGSNHQDAAIVKLSYTPKNAAARIALVGKGICFDTGGHNLKPAKFMQGMHADMNGSAVALALLQALSELKRPVAIDCWLAIAHNHISPAAYMQNDIVTALNGDTIEIVHTDAEGRLVLADTLTLAAREKPQLIIDFATLTGSMVGALGNRYAGVFGSDAALAAQAVSAGQASGERVCAFPLDADYAAGEAGLESKCADVRQCTMSGEADHILAACFLKRFVGDTPWLHVDLSTSGCAGGLGAVASDTTGFGVAWGAQLIGQWLAT